MRFLSSIWSVVAAWFAQAIPAAFEPLDAVGEEDRRRSIHDVTLEQLGIAHWSCHTHF